MYASDTCPACGVEVEEETVRRGWRVDEQVWCVRACVQSEGAGDHACVQERDVHPQRKRERDREREGREGGGARESESESAGPREGV